MLTLLEQDPMGGAPMGPPPGGAPMGAPGPMGGPPPMPGPMGVGGGPPPPMPGLGGPGGMPGTGAPPSNKVMSLKPMGVWQVLDKILKGKPVEEKKEKPSG
jgi:hypothetical protein